MLLENYFTHVNEKYAALLPRTVSNRGECSSGNWRVLRALSNVESHTVRFVGDTDHGTMFETVATAPNRNGFEALGQLVSENVPKTAGR